ncbi:hypothetical protein AB0D49_39470 [Streptomyces sp. NPDC048290]|uniref:hypothetical protein n=1 Tax=Streptomyces sp. NPDC048290 TaxID=3155811 RepID=UPI00342A14E0
MTELHGTRVVPRTSEPGDIPALAALRATSEVAVYWRGGPDLTADVAEDLADPDSR